MADLIVALDYPSADEALEMVEQLGQPATFYKVGLELYTRGGPSFVESLAGFFAVSEEEQPEQPENP